MVRHTGKLIFALLACAIIIPLSFFIPLWVTLILTILFCALLLLSFTLTIEKGDGTSTSRSKNSGFCMRHNFVKRGGPRNIGGGQYEQTLVCKNCGKVKIHKS